MMMTLHQYLESGQLLREYSAPVSTEEWFDGVSSFQSPFFIALCYQADIAGVVNLGEYLSEGLAGIARKMLVPHQRDTFDRGAIEGGESREFTRLISDYIDHSLYELASEREEIEWVTSNGMPAIYIPVAAAYRPGSGSDRLNQLHRMDYQDYLLTPEWRRRREVILESAGFRCQACNTPHKLHVHHRTYERRGYESRSDLIVLCAPCHEVFHEHRLLSRVGEGRS